MKVNDGIWSKEASHSQIVDLLREKRKLVKELIKSDESVILIRCPIISEPTVNKMILVGSRHTVLTE